MIILTADTPRDQEMIEKFQRAYENLRKIVDKLEDENRRLRKENEEYRKRHPSNIGIKNGNHMSYQWQRIYRNLMNLMKCMVQPM